MLSMSYGQRPITPEGINFNVDSLVIHCKCFWPFEMTFINFEIVKDWANVKVTEYWSAEAAIKWYFFANSYLLWPHIIVMLPLNAITIVT